MQFEKQKKYFENLFKDGLLSHAYLFAGQDTAGKSMFAKELCTLITGKNFDNNPNIKFLHLDTEKDIYKIYIENIRDLKLFMSLKPHSSDYKMVMIDDADAMTAEAANALLKILEEPPKRSIFILLSSKPRLLPPTVLSRCEMLNFPPSAEIQTDEMRKAVADLDKIVKQSMAERIKYVKQIHEKENYVELVNLWLKSLRFRLVGEPALSPILKNLLHLSYIISQPQFNHRIALEKFFVNL